MERLPKAVQRFLDGLATGNWDGMEQHLTPDSVQDGSLPGWRVRRQGPDRIVREFREDWTARGAWRFKELTATQAGNTVALELECSLVSPEERITCRFANFFVLRGDRIAEHRFYCPGEWDEAMLRRIEAEAPKIERKEALA